MDLKLQHEQVLYTQVRVKTSNAGGSGTIIYSKASINGEFHTFVLTCNHVIDKAVSVKKDWDPQLGREVKKEFRELVTVEFFDWEASPHGQRPITYGVQAEIVAYDKPHDMALLKLRTVKKSEYVAKLLPKSHIRSMQIGTENIAVGCALLHDPILTHGHITHMGDEIEYKQYWMSSAQIIFGNSGGAVFTNMENSEGQWYFIGIPSRVDVAGWGNAITHLGYFSPINRVYEFLDEQLYHFVMPDHPHKEADCLKEHAEKKQLEKKRVYGDSPEADDKNSRESDDSIF